MPLARVGRQMLDVGRSLAALRTAGPCSGTTAGAGATDLARATLGGDHARRLFCGVVGTVVIALSLTACGGGGSPTSVAHLGKTVPATTVAPGPGGGGNLRQMYLDAVAYTGCMRTHGLPDLAVPTTVDNATQQEVGFGLPPNQQSPQYRAADKACQYLLPGNGAGPSQQMVQQAMTKALKFSVCMRKHGLPRFPDPKANAEGISITGGHGIDPRSPQYQRAQADCRAFSPVG
ncbi:MAG TPA: hypothetical protein VFN61_14970 [Acidimicrobiales bacterium]|nr:hypothetical protein [Acidimicrobiales bacterium]